MLKGISKKKLFDLQKKYGTDEEIGKIYGVTRQAIYDLRKRRGVPSLRVKIKGRNQAIIKAYCRGASLKGLIDSFELSATCIYDVLKNKGIKLRQPRS